MPLKFEVHDANSGAYEYSDAMYGSLFEDSADLSDSYQAGRIGEKPRLAAFDRMLAKAPDFIEAHHYIAVHWYEQGKPKKALDAALFGLSVANRPLRQRRSTTACGLA